MTNLFKQLESADPGTQPYNLNQILDHLTFNADGLIPAICQDASTHQVLMMAWMNLNALTQTLSSREVYFWSRSRQVLWRKGETSGQTQRLVQMHADCDGDTLLLTVKQRGVACHTGRGSCFYNRITPDGLSIDQPIIHHPNTLYGK